MSPSERPADFDGPDDLHRFLVARRSKSSGSLSSEVTAEITEKLTGFRPRWPDHASWLADVVLLPPRTAAQVLARAWPELDPAERRGVIECVRKDVRHGVPATALWLSAAAPDAESALPALTAAMACADRPSVSREFAHAARDALLGSTWPGPFHRLVQAADGTAQPTLQRAARILLEQRLADLPSPVRAGHLADQAAVWLRSEGSEAASSLQRVASLLADAAPRSLATFLELLASAGVAEEWQRAGTRLGFPTGANGEAAAPEAQPAQATVPTAAREPGTLESQAVAVLRASVDGVADILRGATLDVGRGQAEIARLRAEQRSMQEALDHAEAIRATQDARAATAAQQLAALERRIADLQAEQAQLHDMGERRYRAGQQAVAARVSQDIRLLVDTLRQFWEARELSEAEQHVRALVEDLLQALGRHGVSVE